MDGRVIHLIAGYGKILTNGTVYSKSVYIGNADNTHNWTEIDIPEWYTEGSEEIYGAE